MLVNDALEVGKKVAPRGRQVKRVRPPVDGVAATFSEPTLLEIVDEGDHGAAVDPERVAERLLGLTLGGGEVAEHSEVPGMEVQSGEAFGELPMRVCAQLRQQEAEAPAQPTRRGRLHAGGIFGHAGDSTEQLELLLL